jgi:hypothetical protein
MSDQWWGIEPPRKSKIGKYLQKNKNTIKKIPTETTSVSHTSIHLTTPKSHYIYAHHPRKQTMSNPLNILVAPARAALITHLEKMGIAEKDVYGATWIGGTVNLTIHTKNGGKMLNINVGDFYTGNEKG